MAILKFENLISIISCFTFLTTLYLYSLQPVQWIFTLFATPDPTYLWLNPKGGELDFAQLEKYEMDVDVKTGKVKLVGTHFFCTSVL